MPAADSQMTTGFFMLQSWMLDFDTRKERRIGHRGHIPIGRVERREIIINIVIPA